MVLQTPIRGLRMISAVGEDHDGPIPSQSKSSFGGTHCEVPSAQAFLVVVFLLLQWTALLLAALMCRGYLAIACLAFWIARVVCVGRCEECRGQTDAPLYALHECLSGSVRDGVS